MLKRGNIWYTDFTHEGRKIRVSTGFTDKALAQEFEAQERLKHRKGSRLGHVTETFQEAIEAYFVKRATLRANDTTKMHLEWLLKVIPAKTKLDAIDARMIDKVTIASLKATSKSRSAKGVTRSVSTTNRYLGTLRKILNMAHVRGQLPVVPHIEMGEEPESCGRHLTHEQAQKLIAYCAAGKKSAHMGQAIRFALATGLREGNIAGLRWKSVDMDARLVTINWESAKGKKTLRIPLNDDAIAVLNERRGIDFEFVFTYQGKPLGRLNNGTFRDAREAVGVPWLRFHDLRHTWASWKAMAGVPLAVLKELGGWSTMEIVERYAHLSKSHIDGFANFGSLGHNPPAQTSPPVKGRLRAVR